MITRYTPGSLNQLTNTLLRSFGCDANEATIVADHLVDANLAGHDSHGIGMLPTYGEQVHAGFLIPNQTPLLGDANGAISVVDARFGFGHHMALLGLDHAMQTLPTHRVALLGLRNAGHVSRVGTYAEYCAEKGYVSMHFVNVTGHEALVAPFGGREAGISTNPISMAMPVNNAAKPLLDMATSTVAFGKIRVANNKGVEVPSAWLIDQTGKPTSNPKPMVEDRSGALTAFGEHKGSGLGLFVELLAGALVGTHTMAHNDELPDMIINNMLSIIIDPAAFDDSQTIANRTDDFYQYIKNILPATGVDNVLMPGEPEIAMRAERNQYGIPVDDETRRQIVDMGVQFGLEKNAFNALWADNATID